MSDIFINTGETLSLAADEDLLNRGGTIHAEGDAALSAGNIRNETEEKTTRYKELTQTDLGKTASITAGGNLAIHADHDITNTGAVLSAGKDLTMTAGDKIRLEAAAQEKHVAVAYDDSSASIHAVTHQQGLLTGDTLHIQTGGDLDISGTVLSAGKDASITAGGDVSMTAVKDSTSEESEVGRRGSDYYNHTKRSDETVQGSLLAGKEDLTIQAGGDILVKGSAIASETGKAALTAGGDVSITAETESHQYLHEFHEKAGGFLSTKTTDLYEEQSRTDAVGSQISAGSVAVTSGRDTTVQGSAVVGDEDVDIRAGGRFTAESAEETSTSIYEKQVKKSGLLSGGGPGFTIGKEKKKDRYDSTDRTQAGSTIGSLNGNVKIHAGEEATVEASDVIAGKDITITGKEVTVTSADNTYHAQESHEYKRSGLSVSLGGETIEAVGSVLSPLQRAGEVEDKRLAALYGIQAKDQITDIAAKDQQWKQTADSYAMKGNSASNFREKADNYTKADEANANRFGGKNTYAVNVSIGSTKSESHTDSMTTVAQGSTVQAGGDVTLTATGTDLTIKGSTVAGENVTLQAKEDLHILSSENTNTTREDSHMTSASLGASIGAGGLQGIQAGYSEGKGNVKENGTTHTGSTVTAGRELSMKSGKDTDILGSQASGEKVTAEIGGNLNIESQQEEKTYEEKNSSAGISLSYTPGSGAVINGGIGKSDTHSNYESVTDQAGIYAGKDGYDITVERNTALKGAVIDSQAPAEKSSFTAGVLLWENTGNQVRSACSGKSILSAHGSGKAEAISSRRCGISRRKTVSLKE